MAYIRVRERYRFLAYRRDLTSDVRCYEEPWGSLAGSEIHSQLVQHRFVLVEQTTGVTSPTFLVIDMDVLGIEPTGEFLPEIIETFHDYDSSIMALRMMK